MRAKVWSRSSATTGTAPVLLDIDASLVEIHSEDKEQAAPTFKGGFGFHPMFCFADATGETLSGAAASGQRRGQHRGRPRRPCSTTPSPSCPRRSPPATERGDDADLATRTVVVRADSAGCTEGFLAACRARNVGFFVTARSNAQVTAAIFDAIGIEKVWEPARTPRTASLREGAAVCELTSLIDRRQAARRAPG